MTLVNGTRKETERDESMLLTLQFFSKVLGKQSQWVALVPDEKPPRGGWPVLYLLHGLSDDHTIWTRRTRLEMYVQGHPLVVVMPDGHRGFYTDNEEGPRYGTYIAEEVPEVVEGLLPVKRSREGRAIGGLSMGGYGALRAALAYPDRFISAHSHSGAVRAGTMRWDVPHDRVDHREFMRVFGPNPTGTRHDLLHLAKTCPKKKLPALHIDCGTDDFLIEDNRAFHAQLKSLRIPHQYKEHPGSHHWDYWDLHIRDALAFHAEHLGI